MVAVRRRVNATAGAHRSGKLHDRAVYSDDIGKNLPMKKFLAVYMGTMYDEKFKAFMAMPEADRKKTEAAGMAAWGAWMQEYAPHILDNGGPLGKTKKTDMGGVSDTKNDLSGYVVLQAESHEDAAKMFENHPHFTIFPGTSVEIMEILDMPQTA